MVCFLPGLPPRFGDCFNQMDHHDDWSLLWMIYDSGWIQLCIIRQRCNRDNLAWWMSTVDHDHQWPIIHNWCGCTVLYDVYRFGKTTDRNCQQVWNTVHRGVVTRWLTTQGCCIIDGGEIPTVAGETVMTVLRLYSNHHVVDNTRTIVYNLGKVVGGA